MIKRVFLACALAVLAAGCGAPEERAAAGDGTGGETLARSTNRTLALNLGSEPRTIDPSLIEDVASNKVLHGLMEGLVWLDKDIRPQPGVAESWTHNDDFTQWTFNLRPDAKWHNGDPVTAADFKFGVERISTPSTGANYAQIVYNFLEGGEAYYTAGGLDAGLSLDSVKVIDDRTLQYDLAFPAPFFLTMLAFGTWGPVHRATVEEHGAAWANRAETYVGNGPFRMVSYRSRDRIELVKADTYWDAGNIFWEKVDLYMIEDDNTEDSAFRSRTLDVTEGVAVPHIPYWQGRPELRADPSLATYFVTFNNSVKPFDDARIRKAFSKAIDRKLIVERVTRGGEPVSEGLVLHGMPSPIEGKTYRDLAGDMIGPVDVEEARRLMAEAGFTRERPLPPVDYLYNTSDTHKIIGEQMQNMWREAFGVDVRLTNAEWGVVLGRIRSGDYQFARSSWIGDYADPLNFLEIFQTTNSKNGAKYSNPRFDELIDQARVERDEVKREQLLIEAERLLIEEDCVIAPIYTYALTFLVQTDIQDLHLNALGNMTWPRSWRSARR